MIPNGTHISVTPRPGTPPATAEKRRELVRKFYDLTDEAQRAGASVELVLRFLPLPSDDARP